MAGFSSQRRIGSAKAHEFSLISGGYNYRDREDKTNLPPQTLIVGSQNVLTNVSGRIGVRKGYTLDGAADTTLAPILASYDYVMHTGDTQHLRAGFLTTAGSDGKLQYRYVDSNGNVTWRDLQTSLTSTAFNFTNYWDNTNLQSLVLYVNGASSITEWTGGVTTYASKGTTTLTKQGTTSFAQEGFYTTGVHTVVINGLSLGATGGWGTTTLTGIATAALAGLVAAAGDVIHQAPETTLNSAISSLPSTLANALIANLRNQIYIASLTNQDVYISKVNNYKDFSFTSPTRVVGEGALVTLDATPVAFSPQEDAMYVSAGKDFWYQTQFVLSSDLTKEAFNINQLKVGSNQGTQSQGLTTKFRNDIAFLSFEPFIDSLGRVQNIFAVPNITDLSYPIVNTVNNLDFTNGQMIYHRNFLYISAPVSNTTLVYNMTNPQNMYWEAPQILPVGRFSIIDGELYGHSYNTSESYKLFDGYNDNGNFIDGRIMFAFNNFGIPSTSKGFNQFYVEGYISSNTTVNLNFQYDLDGCATNTSFPINGTDTQIVCSPVGDNLLGKYNLGKNPLGSNLTQQNPNGLPPKFRVIKTFPLVPFYEYSVSFESSGVDQQWEILRFGAAEFTTSEGNNAITE